MAIGKLKVGFFKSDESASGRIVSLDRFKDIRDLLVVSADVLDGGGGGEAGDFAHGLDAGETLLAGVSDDVIPVFAAHDFDTSVMVSDRFANDSAHAIDDDDAVKAFIVADSIGAIAESEGWKLVLPGKFIGVTNFLRIFDFDNITSGTAEAHRSKT